MKIESLSIKSSTIIIIGMIGVIAIILSLFAGSYFKQSALNAQINSLSRVIEVASQEMLKQMRGRSFDIAMKLSNNKELVEALHSYNKNDNTIKQMIQLLDDPFVTGFVGFSQIDLEKVRVYSLNYELITESSVGPENYGDGLSEYILNIVKNRKNTEHLKAIDALWDSAEGPAFSTLVPIGGLRPIGYLEIIVNPVFNLPDIGNITNTPVRIYSIAGDMVNANEQEISEGFLPVEFTLNASDGTPAFKIVGYENIDLLSKEMDQTQLVTITSFLILSLSSLLFALWLFNRFLFLPVSRMIGDMQKVSNGKLELTINNEGLREFHILADEFNSMTRQVKLRTNDLQRLLDLDSSALMCFDNDHDAIYFNAGATDLFGYTNSEIIDLDSADFFVEDIPQLLISMKLDRAPQNTVLNCIHKNGEVFAVNANIKVMDVMGKSGFSVLLTPVVVNESNDSTRNDQRLNHVEQTLSDLLAFAKHNPNSIPGLANLDLQKNDESLTGNHKSQLRDQVVKVMNIALSCWEQGLNKTKIELAEESKIWPVYMDKSTPTTRTLDKYLNIDSCPKNPRSQRAVDTAEFVLRKLNKNAAPDEASELRAELNIIRQLVAGTKLRNL